MNSINLWSSKPQVILITNPTGTKKKYSGMGLVWCQLGSGFEHKSGSKLAGTTSSHSGIFFVRRSGNATSSKIIVIIKDTADE